MGLEEKLPSGILLTTVEKVAGYARKSSVWPATFGLACCAIELFHAGGPRHDLARFGMERAAATPRQADLMMREPIRCSQPWFPPEFRLCQSLNLQQSLLPTCTEGPRAALIHQEPQGGG